MMMQATHQHPLLGVKILITRPKIQDESLSKELIGRGAEIVHLPTVAIVPPESYDALDQAIGQLSKYSWIIFTSVNGVEFFSRRLKQVGGSIADLKHAKVATIGPATASALSKLGMAPDFMPKKYLSEMISHGISDVKGQAILLPRADIASKVLPTLLRRRGALVDDVVAYKSIIPAGLTPDSARSIFSGGIDIVTFTSPSTVRNLATVVGPSVLRVMVDGSKVACIGPVTAAAARTYGLHIGIIAQNHTIDDLVEGIEHEIRTI